MPMIQRPEELTALAAGRFGSAGFLTAERVSLQRDTGGIVEASLTHLLPT